MRKPARARTVVFDPASGAALAVCRLLKRLDNLDLLSFEENPGQGWRFESSIRQGGSSMRPRTPSQTCSLRSRSAPSSRGSRAYPVSAALWDCLRTLDAASITRVLGLSLDAPAPPRSPRAPQRVAAWLREAAVLTMLAAALNQAAVELWVVKRSASGNRRSCRRSATR